MVPLFVAAICISPRGLPGKEKEDKYFVEWLTVFLQVYAFSIDIQTSLQIEVRYIIMASQSRTISGAIKFYLEYRFYLRLCFINGIKLSLLKFYLASL